MKKYHYSEAPLRVFGVPFVEQTGRLERLPEEIRRQVSDYLAGLGRRVPGARLCFRTDAGEFKVHMEFEELEIDAGMSIRQAQSALVFIGERPVSRYVGLVSPASYRERTAEEVIRKSGKEEEVTIFLPRNSVVTDISIEVPEEANVLPPTPYRYPVPALYYGPSITEGGCGMVSNSYPAILSRWLDLDFYNFGFSGNARGEKEIADYINRIDKSILIFDYDENAPDPEFLEKTHGPFFQQIRNRSPLLPVVMMSCQSFSADRGGGVRREIIRKNWERARAAGDQNVYFVDGESCYGDRDRELCTLDTIHPNDLGFYRIAETLRPVLEKILNNR